MEQKLDLILQGLNELKNGQKNLEIGLKNLEGRQTNLEKGQKNLELRQKNLEGRQKNIEVGQKELKDISMAIRDRQEETDAKLDNLLMDVHKLHGDLMSLKVSYQRQEKILASLALRSLEQETDLRELKRIK